MKFIVTRWYKIELTPKQLQSVKRQMAEPGAPPSTYLAISDEQAALWLSFECDAGHIVGEVETFDDFEMVTVI